MLIKLLKMKNSKIINKLVDDMPNNLSKYTKLQFTDRALPLVMEALGLSIDSNGYVIKIESGEHVLDADGEIVLASTIEGFEKINGEIYFHLSFPV